MQGLGFDFAFGVVSSGFNLDEGIGLGFSLVWGVVWGSRV